MVRRMTATPDAMRAVCDAYVAAYRNNDKAALLELFADDCEFTDPVGTPTHVGRDAVGKFWDDARAMADSIVLEQKDVTICANEVAMLIEIHATIGGNTMIMDAVDIFVFNDDNQIKTGNWSQTVRDYEYTLGIKRKDIDDDLIGLRAANAIW